MRKDATPAFSGVTEAVSDGAGALASAAVPFKNSATFLNSAKLRWDDSTELIEKTIPDPHYSHGQQKVNVIYAPRLTWDLGVI